MTPEERLDRAEKLIIQLRNKIPFGDWVKYGFNDDLNKIVEDLIAVHGNDPEVVEDKPEVPVTESVKYSGEYMPFVNTSGYVATHTEFEFYMFAAKAVSNCCKQQISCPNCPLHSACKGGSYPPEKWFSYDVIADWKQEFDKMQMPPSGITVDWTPMALPNLKEITRLMGNYTITTDTDWRKY